MARNLNYCLLMSMTLSRRYGRKNFKQSCSCSEAGKKQLNKVSVSRKISKSIFKIEFCEGLLCSACIFIYFQTNMNKCFFLCVYMCTLSHIWLIGSTRNSLQQLESISGLISNHCFLEFCVCQNKARSCKKL